MTTKSCTLINSAIIIRESDHLAYVYTFNKPISDTKSIVQNIIEHFGKDCKYEFGTSGLKLIFPIDFKVFGKEDLTTLTSCSNLNKFIKDNVIVLE